MPYCRNCDNAMDPAAVVCVRCGVPVGAGTRFCQNCRSETDENAVVCVKCGVALAQPVIHYVGGGKSKVAAGILGILLGALGVHNFYLGYVGKGIAQLLITILSCGALSFISAIWGLIEGIMILTGGISVDGQGNRLNES